jgi:hypothetical protein
MAMEPRQTLPETAPAVFALLDRLPPGEAALLRDHMRALGAEAVRQGMLLAGSLMMVARDVAIDFDLVARTLPAMRVCFPEAPRAETLALDAGGD